MKSRYKKIIHKTQKKLKGGTTSMGTIQPPIDLTEIIKIGYCFTNPFCGITKIFEILYTEIRFCIEMMNNVLLESGLYLRNIYNHGGESSLYGIIGEVCYDFFDKNLCTTKINELLYNKPIVKLQIGGEGLNSKLSTNATIIKSYNISISTILSDNKNYIEHYILDQCKEIKPEILFDILKYMKILNDLYKENINEVKIEKKVPISISKNKISVGVNSFKVWNVCSKYQQGTYNREEINKLFGENANIKEICQIEDNTMYEQSLNESKTINYEPIFIHYFFKIVYILKQYYTVKNINSEQLKDEKNDNPFKYFGDPIKTSKPMEDDVYEELKEVYKVISTFSIHTILFKLFLCKFKKLSEHDMVKFIGSLKS